MPKHGDIRNKRVEKAEKTMEYKIVSSGEKGSLSYTASETPVYEKYCDSCKEWVEYKGIVEQLIASEHCIKCGSKWDK